MKLLEFDDHFNARLSAAEKTPWPILRLVMLLDMAARTRDNLAPPQAVSYLRELNSHLAKVIHRWGEQDADPPLDPAMLVQVWHSLNDDWRDPEARAWLEAAVCRGFIRLGATDRLLDFLQECYPDTINDEFTAGLHWKDGLNPLKGKIPAALWDRLEEGDHSQQFASSHRTVKGLFVLQSGEYRAGTLAEISLEKITVSEKLALDQVRIATHLVDESDVLSQQTQAVCRYLRNKHYGNDRQKLRLEYALDQPASLLVGSSAGLAFALLGELGLYTYRQNRPVEPKIYSDVALTGSVDETGAVLPVSSSTLKYKMEAAFFGSIRTVVLPPSQENEARKILRELQQKYPRRQLDILPVGTVSALTQRREVVHYQRRRVAARLSQFVHDYANSVTLMILGFIVLVGLGFWFGVVKNTVPASVEDVELNHVHHAEVKNRFGYTIWRIDDDSRATLADLDGDGTNEILVGYAKEVDTIKRGYLFCYNQDFSLRWKKKVSHAVKFGGMDYSDFFSIQFMTIDDFNSDGKKEICVQISHNYFPYCYMVLSSSGEILSQYWNSGGLNDVTVIDLIPDNGTKELVLVGENNEYKCGVLVLLDPFNMYGASPQSDPYYTMEGAKTGGELAYIRFPTTHFQEGQNRDKARLLGINQENIIRLGLVNWPTYNGEIGDLVIYHLNKNLQPIFLDLTDFYYSTYNNQFPYKPKLKYNDPNLIDHFRKILYWDRKSWSYQDPLLGREK